MESTRQRFPITEGALVKRINRKYVSESDCDYLYVLRKTRGHRAWIQLGDFHLVNTQYNIIVDDHIDIEELGREMGVLKDYEYMVEEGIACEESAAA